MTATNTQLRYGTVAIAFHWIIAALILANIGLGLYFADLPRSDPNKFELVQFHKSIGLTVLTLSALRVVWRVVNPVPALPSDMNAFLHAVARGSHYLLYFLIIAIPLSGWMLVSSSPLGLPTNYFHLFSWPNLWFLSELPRAQKIPLRENFDNVHVFLAWSAIVLIPIHVAGALYHHFIHRDEILKRMLPGTTITGPEAAE
jgi:cytochrome b561